MTACAFVLVLAVTACGGSRAWKPHPIFNAIKVVGPTVLRGDADGTITATVIVQLDDQSGAGTVRLRTTSLEAATTSPHLALARARGWQVLTKLLAADAPRAFEAARRGVSEIRTCCGGGDSGMYARHAELNWDEPGGQAAALATMERVLDDLIVSYVRRHHVAAL